jgi:serine/threonine protein kinase/tetratricopeptide (TPR) repeat protein
LATKCPQCYSENPEIKQFCADCGTRLAPSSREIHPEVAETLQTPIHELTTGSTFAGRYQVIEELGHGGMGRVYKVFDTDIKEKIALKLLRPEIALGRETIERFSNELKLARKISHRNVCRMFDLGKAEGTTFITMEFVAGEDLKRLIRKMGQLGAGRAVSIAKQVCEGLMEAHHLGVVHRDLKPQNIMVDEDGNAQIMDFGIARSMQGKGITGAGVMIGTPEYMSPEQVEGKEIDQRSDIYSLGIVLYEMLTGRVPFEGDTSFTIGVKHKSEIPRDPRQINTQIPQDLARLVLKCLEKDKAKRYQSAAELRADLERVELGLPTTERVLSARKPPTSRKITVEFTPKKLLVPAAAVAALVIAAVVLWHPWTSSKTAAPGPKVENSIAVISFQNLTGDSRYDSLIKAVPNLLITKFESMGIPYVASWERLQDLLKQMGKDPDAPIDKETGFEICRREGIAVLITGEVARAGNVFVTNLKAIDAGTKGSLASASAQGQGEESILLSQIDDLTGRVHLKLGWALPGGEAAPPIAEFTTTSMEAYNDFLKGRDFYEKKYFEEARQALQRAVDRDPEFASAHLYLAHAYQGLRLFKLGDETYKKAEALSAKANEKERLYIAAEVEENPEKYCRILQELAAKYPREKRPHLSLASYYRDKKAFPEAIGELDKALELDPVYALALEGFAYVYMDMKELDKAAEYLKKFSAVNPGDAEPYAAMGDLLFRAGRLDEAIAGYRDMLKVKPDYGAGDRIAYVQAVKGEYQEALRAMDDFIKNAPSPGIRMYGLMWRAFLYHVVGRRDAAIKEEDEAIKNLGSVNPYFVSVAKLFKAFFYYDRGEYDKGRRLAQEYFDFNKAEDPSLGGIRMNESLLEYYLALCDAKQGRLESARKRHEKASRLEAQARADSQGWAAQAQRMGTIVLAEILLAEGKAGEAITVMEKELVLTIPWINNRPDYTLHNMPIEQDVLARAHRKTGNIDKAIEAYLKLLTFDPSSQDRRLHIPVYHCRLARLYEEKGEKDKAVAQYRIFLDLWKDADPGIPEFEDARKRLAGLKGS